MSARPLGPADLVLCAGTVQATPFLDRLAPAKAAGFAGVSMMAVDLEPLTAQGVTPAEVRSRVADAGLAIAEFECVGRWFAAQKPEQHPGDWLKALLGRFTPEYICPLAEAVGARSVVVVEMFGADDDLDRMAEGFAHACDVAAEHGLLAHLEFIPAGGIPTLGKAWAVIERAGRPNGGLHVDSWHLFRGGSTLEELRRIPGERIFCVQVADAPAQAQGDLREELMHARLMPGEGAFDLTGFIQALDAVGCQAPWGVEVFADAHASEPPEVVARRCAQAMQELFRKARNA